jgi:hypothetical protein
MARSVNAAALRAGAPVQVATVAQPRSPIPANSLTSRYSLTSSMVSARTVPFDIAGFCNARGRVQFDQIVQFDRIRTFRRLPVGERTRQLRGLHHRRRRRASRPPRRTPLVALPRAVKDDMRMTPLAPAEPGQGAGRDARPPPERRGREVVDMRFKAAPATTALAASCRVSAGSQFEAVPVD